MADRQMEALTLRELGGVDVVGVWYCRKLLTALPNSFGSVYQLEQGGG